MAEDAVAVTETIQNQTTPESIKQSTDVLVKQATSLIFVPNIYPTAGTLLEQQVDSQKALKNGEDMARIKKVAFHNTDQFDEKEKQQMVAAAFSIQAQENLGLPNLTVVKKDSNGQAVAMVLAYQGRVPGNDLYKNGFTEEIAREMTDLGYQNIDRYANKKLDLVYLAEWDSVPGNTIAAGKAIKEFMDKYSQEYLSGKREPLPIYTHARVSTSGAVLEKQFDSIAQELSKKHGKEVKVFKMKVVENEGEPYQQYLIVPQREPVDNPYGVDIVKKRTEQYAKLSDRIESELKSAPKEYIDDIEKLWDEIEQSKRITFQRGADERDPKLDIYEDDQFFIGLNGGRYQIKGWSQSYSSFPDLKYIDVTQADNPENASRYNLGLLVHALGNHRYSQNGDQLPFTKEQLDQMLGGNPSLIYFADKILIPHFEQPLKVELTPEKAMEKKWRKNHEGLFFVEKVPEVEDVQYKFDPETEKVEVLIKSVDAVSFKYVLSEDEPQAITNRREINAEVFEIIDSKGQIKSLLPISGVGYKIYTEENELIQRNIPPEVFLTDWSNVKDLPNLSPDDIRLVRTMYFFMNSEFARNRYEPGDKGNIRTPLVYDLNSLEVYMHEKSHSEDEKMKVEFDESEEEVDRKIAAQEFLKEKRRSERYAVGGEMFKMRNLFNELGIPIYQEKDGQKVFSDKFQQVLDMSYIGLMGYFLGTYNSPISSPQDRPVHQRYFNPQEAYKYRNLYDATNTLRTLK